MRILLVDNRDSFTWNIAMALSELGAEVEVVRAAELTPRAVHDYAPEAIVIGPGPGRPEDATISLELLRELGDQVPMLGICLGHQALAVAFGGRIVRSTTLAHGRAVPVQHEGAGIFAGLPSPSWFTLYNSLVVDPAAVPECLEVTARTEDGAIMGLRHVELPLEGVQFHPESVLSERGLELLQNFLDGAREP